MKLFEVILKPPRAYALAIQQYVIEEFDDDNLGCDLTMELGFPAVLFTIDLPYYKESVFLHSTSCTVSAGPGYVVRENLPGHIAIGKQCATIPELLEHTINVIATEGPATAPAKSFGYYFQKAHRFPDEGDSFMPDTITKIMTAVLKGKRVKVVSTRIDQPPKFEPGVRYEAVMVNGNKALMIES